MTRTPIRDRRPNVTVKVRHEWASGNQQSVIVTLGVEDGRVRELFCSDFKAGTDMQTFVMDTCMILSLLLQHGYTVRELHDKLAPAPQSLLATLVNAAIEVEK